MELDEVLDQMIAERVIHRHRRKWIAAFVALVLAIGLIWVFGGWSEPARADVDIVQAPYTIRTGRFEFQIDSATLTKTPAGKYSEAKAEITVRMGIRNIDEETQESDSVLSDLLYIAVKKGDPIKSSGTTCNGELNYKLVYGLPTQECSVRFEVPPTYSDTAVRLAVFDEEYRSDSGTIGATDEEYWHTGDLQVIVELTAKQETGS